MLGMSSRVEPVQEVTLEQRFPRESVLELRLRVTEKRLRISELLREAQWLEHSIELMEMTAGVAPL